MIGKQVTKLWRLTSPTSAQSTSSFSRCYRAGLLPHQLALGLSNDLGRFFDVISFARGKQHVVFGRNFQPWETTPNPKVGLFWTQFPEFHIFYPLSITEYSRWHTPKSSVILPQLNMTCFSKSSTELCLQAVFEIY